MKTRKEADAAAKEIRRALRGCRLAGYTAACEVRKVLYSRKEEGFLCRVRAKSRCGFTSLHYAEMAAASIVACIDAAVPSVGRPADPLIRPVDDTVALFFDFFGAPAQKRD